MKKRLRGTAPGEPFVGGEASPDAVAFAGADCVIEAFGAHRARLADRLGAQLTRLAVALALTAERWIEVAPGLASAKRPSLPFQVSRHHAATVGTVSRRGNDGAAVFTQGSPPGNALLRVVRGRVVGRSAAVTVVTRRPLEWLDLEGDPVDGDDAHG